MKIDYGLTWEWTEDQTRTFRNYEDQWYNLCLDHGIPDERAIEVGNRYNEQREGCKVDPEKVLNRWHLAIWREFTQKSLDSAPEQPNL